MWYDTFKELGVSIHIVATGAGAGLQQKLWEIPGSSAYLSGASFPYSTEEQVELLGFSPEHFCSEEASIHLAAAAYMKAYKFGGKKPVGIGLTASVASEKIHRGEHRAFVTIITDDVVLTASKTFEKKTGHLPRHLDGIGCDSLAFFSLLQVLLKDQSYDAGIQLHDNTELAKQLFFDRPFFTANGKRLPTMANSTNLAIMPGAFNPPHEGHFSAVSHVMSEYNKTVVFEITAQPPHKPALSIQDLLKRAKLLQGYDRFFSRSEPLYLDKAKAMPGVPLVLGADAMVRMLDPKWGVEPAELLQEFNKLNTKLLVAGRMIQDKFVSCQDILKDLRTNNPYVWSHAITVMLPVDGRVDMSSTEIRTLSRVCHCGAPATCMGKYGHLYCDEHSIDDLDTIRFT